MKRHTIAPTLLGGVGAALAVATLEAAGSFYNVRAYAEYCFRGRYGAGLAISAFGLAIEADKPRLTGEYQYDCRGTPVIWTRVSDPAGRSN